MNKEQPIMEISNVCKDFKVKSSGLFKQSKVLHALSDISLSVNKGETLGIIGESGCGKSTLGKSIVMLNKVTSGDILYNNQSVINFKGKELKEYRREVQMIFQDPFSSLDPRKTAGQIIEEPMIIHKTVTNKNDRKNLVIDLMHEVGLDLQHYHRYPHEFSGGQRQRINVARALALKPKVIVCDEPVSALDVSVQAQVLNLLNDVQNKFNLTYIFISHDLSVIKYISHRIAIMYLGNIVELCDSKTIYKNPLHPYSKALLSAIPPESPFEEIKELPLKGEIPSPIGIMQGCPLAVRCQYAQEKCFKEKPVLKEVETNHSVACFLLQ